MVHIFSDDEVMLLGVSDGKIKATMAHLGDFFGNNRTESATIRYDPVEVLRQSKDSFSRLYAVLDRHACMLNDFQVLLHRDGRLIHLDMDRCYQWDVDHERKLPLRELYLTRLQKLQQTIEAILEKRVTAAQKK